MTDKMNGIFLDISSIYGKKVGMSFLFSSEGKRLPITLIQILDNYILSSDCENKRLIIGYDIAKEKHMNKPQIVESQKMSVPLFRHKNQINFCASQENCQESKNLVGFEIKDMAESFFIGQLINIQGRTKGKGFAGGIKAHHFKGNRSSGASLVKRSIGSTGQRQDPGKVFKGKKMPKRLGNDLRTASNLQIAYIDNNIIGVVGCVPGGKNGLLKIAPSKKSNAKLFAVKFNKN